MGGGGAEDDDVEQTTTNRQQQSPSHKIFQARAGSNGLGIKAGFSDLEVHYIEYLPRSFCYSGRIHRPIQF